MSQREGAGANEEPRLLVINFLISERYSFYVRFIIAI